MQVETQVNGSEIKAVTTGQFHKGQIVVDGITIEYISYGISEGVIDVGTYYPLK